MHLLPFIIKSSKSFSKGVRSSVDDLIKTVSILYLNENCVAMIIYYNKLLHIVRQSRIGDLLEQEQAGFEPGTACWK